jgi:uncharacterized protein (TIGR03083 family)
MSRESPGPILTAHLFPKLEHRLIELLKSLAPDDWGKPTISPKWRVKDVAAHLLDTQLRGLSVARDGWRVRKGGLRSPASLGAFINRLNHRGVRTFSLLSPKVLISLMEVVSRQFSRYHQSLDPFADAPFGVSWAGEAVSANWFNTAREFTERWHHQQQIRLAVDRPGIMTREFYYPVLDCFMRALPYTYRKMRGRTGTFVEIVVSGKCGGRWYLYREPDAWRLTVSRAGSRISCVEIPQEIAWRIFTRGIDRKSALSQVRITGNRALGFHLLSAVAIVGSSSAALNLRVAGGRHLSRVEPQNVNFNAN